MNKPLKRVLEAFIPISKSEKYHKKFIHHQVGDELLFEFVADSTHHLSVHFFEFKKEKSINVLIDFETYQNKVLITKNTYALSDVIKGSVIPGILQDDQESIKKFYRYTLKEGIIQNDQDMETAADSLSKIIISNLNGLKSACINEKKGGN